MKKILFWLIITCTYSFSVTSQKSNDSLVIFSDIRYHSEFEKNALQNFVKHKTDTFRLFLAIDEGFEESDFNKYFMAYSGLYADFSKKKLESKKLNKKIKTAYSIVHSKFLKRYNENQYYQAIFEGGSYNCLSASMLYSLVFEQLETPYKVMVASNHVYLIANPGPNSIVIETTNPSFEKKIFTGEFKQQYVKHLSASKLISKDDLKNKSVEEIFEEKYNEVREAKFNNLAGLQYYNKALSKMQKNKAEEGYKLCQKAYYFYPDPQVKTLLYIGLLLQLEKCEFDKISDMDYLAQLSRFEDADQKMLLGIFNNVVNHFLQYTDKEEYCNSLEERLTSQISNKKTVDEIKFSFNMQMAYRYMNTNKVEKYIVNALKVKDNHHDANLIFSRLIQRKLDYVDNGYAFLDTVKLLKKKYNFENIQPMLNEYELVAYLKIADESFDEHKIKEGEKYLNLFESNYTPPHKTNLLGNVIERTYRSISLYYRYRKNKIKAKSYIERGLKYKPNSYLIKSALD